MEQGSGIPLWSILLGSVVGGGTFLMLTLRRCYASLRWFWSVDRDLGDLKDAVEKITSEISVIHEDIKKILSRLGQEVVEPGSPLKLTDYGQEVANSIAANPWAISVAETLMVDVSGLLPHEIDAFCIGYVQKQLGEPMRETVARYAYEHGVESDDVKRVLQVVLRDELLRRMETDKGEIS